MNKFMFSIRDCKAETWSFPFQSDNNATAIRDFTTLVNDPRTLVGQHPEDFDLFSLGTFSLSEGVIRTEVPVHLANGNDVHRSE